MVIIGVIRWCVKWTRHVACMGEKRNAYKFPVRNPEGKIQDISCYDPQQSVLATEGYVVTERD